LIGADDLRRLADQAGFGTDLTEDELATQAGRLNFAFSIGFVGQRRNDRATAATGEVHRWGLGLHYAVSQQYLGLGFGEGTSEDHRLSARRYFAHAFGHDSTSEALRMVVRRNAERFGVRPGASSVELVSTVIERAADAAIVLQLLAGHMATVAAKAPRSKPATDDAISEFFKDLRDVYETIHNVPFGVSNHPPSPNAEDQSRYRPAGPAFRWATALFGLAAERAASAGKGAVELAELAEWGRSRPNGVWRAIHLARSLKMQSENH
jgi:hypothetical protein